MLLKYGSQTHMIFIYFSFLHTVSYHILKIILIMKIIKLFKKVNNFIEIK